MILTGNLSPFSFLLSLPSTTIETLCISLPPLFITFIRHAMHIDSIIHAPKKRKLAAETTNKADDDDKAAVGTEHSKPAPAAQQDDDTARQQGVDKQQRQEKKLQSPQGILAACKKSRATCSRARLVFRCAIVFRPIWPWARALPCNSRKNLDV